MSAHSLIFGGLELCDPEGLGASEGGYWFETLAEGASFGDAQPVEVGVNSLLRDGSLVRTDRYENREQTWRVTVKATDQAGLAAGVAALDRVVGTRTTLTWTPPDGYAPSTVFEVETSSLTSPNGFEGLRFVENEMTFALRLVCQPFGRSVDLINSTASALPSTVDVFNSCETPADWSGNAWVPGSTASWSDDMVTYYTVHGYDMPPYSAPTAFQVDAVKYVEGAGSMKVAPYYAGKIGYPTYPNASYFSYHFEVDTGGEAIAGSGYLSFSIRGLSETMLPIEPYPRAVGLQTVYITSAEHGRQLLYTKVDGWFPSYYREGTGVLGSPVIQYLPDGWMRFTFRVTDALTIDALEFYAHREQYTEVIDGDYPPIWIDEIAVAESSSTSRQMLQTFSVVGSQRTPGSIHIASSSDSVPLGDVLVFTCSQDDVPTGFLPDLRQWVQAGDTTAVSDSSFGSSFDEIGTTYGASVSGGGAVAPLFEAPASMFAGTAHTIVARIQRRGDDAATFGVEASLMLGGDVVYEPQTVESYLPEYPGVSWPFEFVVLGSLYLPPTLIDDPQTDALVRFRFKSGVQLYLDDVYALPIGGDLTIIECGTGTVGAEASSHLWIDSPSAYQPQGAYWRGESNSRQSALSAWAGAQVPGVHTLKPGQNLLFATATNADGPSGDFGYFPRWGTHAAR